MVRRETRIPVGQADCNLSKIVTILLPTSGTSFPIGVLGPFSARLAQFRDAWLTESIFGVNSPLIVTELHKLGSLA